MKKNLFITGLALLSFTIFSCDNNASVENNVLTDDVVLEELSQESLTSLAANISDAVEGIQSSNAYDIITLSDVASKSTSVETADSVVFNVSLADIAGVYTYAPVVDTVWFKHRYKLRYDYFSKTADSDLFIMTLPEEKATRYRDLFNVDDSDTALVNNFKVITSAFVYNDFEDRGSYNYLVNSAVEVDDESLGSLYVSSSREQGISSTYNASYNFTNDYAVSVVYNYVNDTLTRDFRITEAGNTVYAESSVKVKNETSRSRRLSTYKYTLDLGNIKIDKVRESDSTSYAVYVGGVIDENAVVEAIVDEGDEAEMFCKQKKDLKITLDDGTELILSELIGDTRDGLGAIYDAMHDVNFSQKLVNNLAWRVYYENSVE